MKKDVKTTIANWDTRKNNGTITELKLSLRTGEHPDSFNSEEIQELIKEKNHQILNGNFNSIFNQN